MSGPASAALLTPSGRGAIATIRVAVDWPAWPSLDAIPFRPANGRQLSDQRVGRVIFGRWGVDFEEEVVVCLVDRHALEIHCHGGAAAAQRILRDLAGVGCRAVAWPELLRETESPLRAEILDELSRATTLRTAAILWEQANGVFESAVHALNASAPDNLPAAADQLRSWLEWREFGLHLTRPWSVVLVGRPNVGKSSLINAILGYTRSLVFDRPGTTRDVVSAATAIDGWPIEFSDTAGLRESTDPLESAGIERARATLEVTDLPLVLVEISQPLLPADRALIAENPRAIVVAHKCDLGVCQQPDDELQRESTKWLRVSAKTGVGVDELVAAIAAKLVPAVPPPDMLLPLTARQAALLQGAWEAAKRSDATALSQQLQALIAGTECAASDQDSRAKAKGSPATS